MNNSSCKRILAAPAGARWGSSCREDGLSATTWDVEMNVYFVYEDRFRVRVIYAHKIANDKNVAVALHNQKNRQWRELQWSEQHVVIHGAIFCTTSCR